ncbi:CHAP domain-containing protein [Nocardioides sp. CN2-186]|uniref:CHAP domain-containing protein n=1 Tax=Nocardioides tweenelious TaxID=3156607 RepID=UPI0032B44BB0
MSSSPSVLDRAASAPRWLVVALSLVAIAVLVTVAGHRHLAPVTTAAEDADAVIEPAAAATVERAPIVSRSAPLTRKPTLRGPIANSDAAQTVAAAKASAYNVPGQCLGWSREQADIPSRYQSAADSWEHATGRHRGDMTPPKGAAVYWLGGSYGYGHVAISVGHGMVRSSDAGGAGVVATISVRRLTREWHLTYAGWAPSINGYRIPGVAST